MRVISHVVHLAADKIIFINDLFISVGILVHYIGKAGNKLIAVMLQQRIHIAVDVVSEKAGGLRGLFCTQLQWCY
jgi:hypothetical protein